MPLKEKQIEEFKNRLIEMRNQMTQHVSRAARQVKEGDEVKGYSQHQADEGTDDFVRSVNLELTSREYQILRQIERALEKVDENTYGICDITQNEIPLPRLEAIPYAIMTVDAQNKMEKGEL